MRWLCITLLSVGLLIKGTAQEQPKAVPKEEISPALAADPRLDRHVSIANERMYLGELLDSISSKTGVALEASARTGPISGYELTVSVRSRPAREVMEAIRRLYNSPADRWTWARGMEDRSSYVLSASLPCTAARDARSAYVENYLLGELRKRGEFYALPPAQRAQLAQRDPLLKACDHPRSRGFYSFVSGLSDADVRTIIRGQPLNMPMERLSAGQREFVVNEFRIANVLGRADVKQPEDLRQVSLIYSGEDKPAIYLNLGPIGAHGVIGGAWATEALEDWQRNLDQAWQGPREDRRAPRTPLSLVHGDTPLLFDRALHSYNRRLLQDKSPTAVLNLDGKHVSWKRWHEFVLVRPRDWTLCERGEAAPWPLRRDLRRVAEKNNGYLRPQDWVRMSGLDREQLWQLEEEFPDATKVVMLKSILELWAQMSDREQAAAERAGGAKWSDFSNRTRALLIKTRGATTARKFRLFLQWDTGTRPPHVRAAGYFEPNRQQPGDYPFQKRSAHVD